MDITTNDITSWMRFKKLIFPYNLRMFMPKELITIYLRLKDLETFDLSSSIEAFGPSGTLDDPESIEAPVLRFFASIFSTATKEGAKELKLLEIPGQSLTVWLDGVEICSLPSTLIDTIQVTCGFFAADKKVQFKKDFVYRDKEWEVLHGDKSYYSLRHLHDELAKIGQGKFRVKTSKNAFSLRFVRHGNESKFLFES